MRPMILALSLLLPLAMLSQKVRIARTSIYFESNHFKLSKKEEQKLDKLFNKLADREIIGISLLGHTDSDADSLYNIKLSNKRVSAVNDYLKKYNTPFAKRNLKHFGENNPNKSNVTESGKQANRRVEVIVSYRKLSQVAQQEPTLIEEKVEKKASSQDTLIQFSEGTIISMNKIEYEEKKDCLDFNEAVSLDQIIESGMNTEASNGGGLNSFGMMQVNVSQKPGCDFECFDKPIKIRFPVPDGDGCDYNRRAARPYVLNEDGTWDRAPRADMKIISVDGRKYYEHKTQCAGFGINYDAPIPELTKSTIVYKKGLKPIRLVVSNDCPRIVVNQFEIKSKCSAEIEIPSVWANYNIEGEFVDENNDTVYLERQALNQLYKRRMFGGWPNRYFSMDDRYWRNGFYIREKSIYRRYYVLNGDLVMSRSVALK